MLLPALVYFGVNMHTLNYTRMGHSSYNGYCLFTGYLSIARSRIPTSLKVFLTALAIFDDIGAIIVIAAFYTKYVSMFLLLVALA